MLAADWIVDNQQPDGRWLYEYDRATDDDLEVPKVGAIVQTEILVGQIAPADYRYPVVGDKGLVVHAMVETMEQHFGSCTNHGECSKACPKSISIDFIAMMNRDYVKAKFKNLRLAAQSG